MAREFDTQIKFGVTDNATPHIRALSAEFRRMSSARETLGIRSERNIQREIARTMAAWSAVVHCRPTNKSAPMTRCSPALPGCARRWPEPNVSSAAGARRHSPSAAV
ncbi:MAG: hypothetical protein G5702_02320 [Serratia symbiotica]|nr:hypothetical protein [Serratia symbiotica]